MHGSKRSGAAIVVVIVIIAVLAIAGAGVWYFLLRSTPEKTLHVMFAAQRAGDLDGVRACITERSAPWIDALARVMGRAGDRDFEYALGDSAITDDRATVPVTFPLPESIARYARSSDYTLTFALQREDGKWRVDLQDTMGATLGGLMGGMMGGGPPEGEAPQ